MPSETTISPPASPPGAKSASGFLIDLAALLALFAIVCGPYLLRVYASALPGGWDGVPHYAIADVYAHKLFPAISGWLGEYFAGMPFPNFYPPVFYMIVAALTKLGFSTRTAFWVVQTAGSAAVPCLTYLGARRLAAVVDPAALPESGRGAGLVAGAITVGFMVDHNPFWRMGITLHSTFDAGLSTQLLAHVFLLAFYWALLAADEGRAWAALSAIFFALVPLTNVHMVWAAAFIFLTHTTARLLAASTRAERRRLLLLHGTIGLAGLLISAGWVIPMIAEIRFVPTQALNPPGPGVVVFAFLRLGVYLVFATVAAAARRDRRALALIAALVLLLAFTLMPSARLPVLRDLALQPARVLVPFPFLAAFLVGYLVSAAPYVLRRWWTQPAVGVACALVFFLHFKLETEPVANVTAAQVENYENVLGPLDGRSDGRVLVEMGPDGLSDPFALQSLAGMRGARAVTTVFRESALDVLFAVPLRNSFSGPQEAFGVDHKITGAEMWSDPPERHMARLRLFNVRYFAVRTDAAKAHLSSLPGVRRASPPGLWELWSFNAEAPGYAAVPVYAPVLTFARFSVKPRPDDGVDFVRLGEEMFAAGRLDVPLALAREPKLDRSEDWDGFRAALITEYRYDDIDRAFTVIELVSRDRAVVLWPTPDPLYARLCDLAATRSTLRLVAAPGGTPTSTIERRAWGRAAVTRILDAIDAVKIPLAGAPSVNAARLDDDRASIQLDRVPEQRTPIWVRQGYFPSWKSAEGEPVYLATPTFQLTFTRRKDVELRFERRAVDWAARLCAALGLGLVALLGKSGVWGARCRGRQPR